MYIMGKRDSCIVTQIVEQARQKGQHGVTWTLIKAVTQQFWYLEPIICYMISNK